MLGQKDAPVPRRPRNIVIYSDGTGQRGGLYFDEERTNVYKLYRGSRVSPAPVRFVQKLLASVIGRGITTNIADGYEFIINHYQPGDRIFLIGFSRGAYTVCRIA